MLLLCTKKQGIKKYFNSNNSKFMKVMFLSVFLLCFCKGRTQDLKALDTIYYLADTAKVPVKDRIVEIGVEGPFRYFAIKCSCLAYNQNAVFISKRDDLGENISVVALKKIKLISLYHLIKLASDNGGNIFNYKHVAYILEPFERNYIKRKVILPKPTRQDVRY